jgi:small nuclear ribonucleoprotein (snRNP)-like protein
VRSDTCRAASATLAENSGCILTTNPSPKFRAKRKRRNKNSTLKRVRPFSGHGLAHPVHNFRVAGGLRRPYVSIHPWLPDRDKTAHSSPRFRKLGKMLVVLRDGRKLFGVLRSYDQFGTHDPRRSCLWGRLNVPLTDASWLHFTANLVLEDTVERIYHQDVFAEQWVGLFLIRGENVVLLGEIVSITTSPPLPRPTLCVVWGS